MWALGKKWTDRTEHNFCTQLMPSLILRSSWTADLEVTGSSTKSFQSDNKETLEYILALCGAHVQPT